MHLPNPCRGLLRSGSSEAYCPAALARTAGGCFPFRLRAANSMWGVLPWGILMADAPLGACCLRGPLEHLLFEGPFWSSGRLLGPASSVWWGGVRPGVDWSSARLSSLRTGPKGAGRYCLSRRIHYSACGGVRPELPGLRGPGLNRLRELMVLRPECVVRPGPHLVTIVSWCIVLNQRSQDELDPM